MGWGQCSTPLGGGVGDSGGSGISVPGMTVPLHTIFWTSTPNPGTVFLFPRESAGLTGGLLLPPLLPVTLGALLACSEPQFPPPGRWLPRHPAPTRGQCWPGFGATWRRRNFSASRPRVGNFSPRAAPVPPAPAPLPARSFAAPERPPATCPPTRAWWPLVSQLLLLTLCSLTKNC